MKMPSEIESRRATKKQTKSKAKKNNGKNRGKKTTPKTIVSLWKRPEREREYKAAAGAAAVVGCSYFLLIQTAWW